jgi:hypothetical protein
MVDLLPFDRAVSWSKGRASEIVDVASTHVYVEKIPQLSRVTKSPSVLLLEG